MKKLLLLGIGFGLIMLYGMANASYDPALQNRINFNKMLSTYPELRNANIRLVPVGAEALLVREIKDDPDSETPRISSYHIDTDTIFVQKDLNPFVFQYWVMHEFCHHISYVEMEDWEWKKWNRLYETHPNHMSAYSKTNADEGWAESCAIYKYGMRDRYTYAGVESVFDSPQGKFMNTIFPKYRKPL